jgi:CTP synthase (UTP-ammonia lyase)
MQEPEAFIIHQEILAMLARHQRFIPKAEPEVQVQPEQTVMQGLQGVFLKQDMVLLPVSQELKELMVSAVAAAAAVEVEILIVTVMDQLAVVVAQADAKEVPAHRVQAAADLSVFLPLIVILFLQ